MKRFRRDVLEARCLYVNFANEFNIKDKLQIRHLFIKTLKRATKEGLCLVPVVEEWPICATLVSRIFGLSLANMMDILMDVGTPLPIFRNWYQKTVDRLSDTLLQLSKFAQPNSLSQLMLPPKFSERCLTGDRKSIPIKTLSKKMDLPFRERKADTLLRCAQCHALPDLIRKSPDPKIKKEAEKHLKGHLKLVDQQRTIMATLSKQSMDDSIDVIVGQFDAMANSRSKLPVVIDKTKAIPDNDRVILSITTVQFSLARNGYTNTNFDYVLLSGVYPHDSSYNLSLLLDGLLKIHLLFPMVGHTHFSVDAHFGSISKFFDDKEALDPIAFVDKLKEMPSVTSVESAPTIFDFTKVSEGIWKPPNLCSHNQLILSKSNNGEIFWSVAKSMMSSDLFATDNKCSSFRMFKDNFNPATFIPPIRKPTTEAAAEKSKTLFKVAGASFTDTNRVNYFEFGKQYGKIAFQRIMQELNKKPPKVQLDLTGTADMTASTIIDFITSNGYNIAKFPNDPIVSKQIPS
ncbi:unnamed protein product [Caenorhabditis brenneri]